MDPDKDEFAQDTPHRTLAEAIAGADVFLGLSAAGVLKPAMVQVDGRAADHLRAGQPDARDLARGSQGRARRRDHGHRPHRLPEPGQQRPVLPVHLPRRARLRRDDDHRRDGDRRGARDRRAGAGRAERSGGRGLRGRDAVVRPRVPDSQALRPAADDEDRAGRGPGRGRIGRGAAADRRHGGLPRAPADLRLRLGHDDAADLRLGQAGQGQARGLRRGRGRTRAARGAGGGRRRPGAADADRPAGGHCAARRALRPAPEGGRRLRRRQRRARPPLPRLLADLPRA